MSCTNNSLNLIAQTALRDVKNIVMQYGAPVEFHGIKTLPIVGDEPEIGENTRVTRDKYGSIIDRSKVAVMLNSYPIDYSPSSKQLLGLGMTEQVDAVIYLSTLEITEKGYGYQSFDAIETSVIIEDVEYKIKDRRQHSQFGNTYLYIVLGLKRS